MCGPSKQQSEAYNNQTKLNQDITGQMSTIFGDNKNILSSVTGALTPVVDKGVNQYGFNPAEDAALRTQATDANAAAGQQTTNAVRSTLAGEGGGTTYLPSGSEATIEGQLAQTEAQKEADTQLGITEKGYDQGRQNFFEADSALTGGAAQLESPEISAENAASGSQGQENNAAESITQANDAWVAPVAGLLGSVGGAAVGKIGGNKGSNG